MTHKPLCHIFIKCTVYHPDGICPGPYGTCTCGATTTLPSNHIVNQALDQRGLISHGLIYNPPPENNDWAIKARAYHPNHLGAAGGYCMACALIDLGIDMFAQQEERIKDGIARALEILPAHPNYTRDARTLEDALSIIRNFKSH